MLADVKTIYFGGYSDQEGMGSITEGRVTVEFGKGGNTPTRRFTPPTAAVSVFMPKIPSLSLSQEITTSTR